MPSHSSTPPAALPIRFWLFALLLHVLVLAYPVSRALTEIQINTTALDVRVTAAAHPPQLAPPNTTPPRPSMPVKSPAPPKLLTVPDKTPHANTVVSQPPPVSAIASAAPVPPIAAAPAAPAPSPPAAAQPVIQAARFDAAYLKNPRPAYPPLSRRLNEEGQVVLRVLVSPEGLPTRVEIAQSSRFSRLDEAARQAVERWHFVPARKGSEAIEAQVLVPLIFRLED